MNTQLSLANTSVLLVSLLNAASCATLYRPEAPLALVMDVAAPMRFDDIPYTSLDGSEWPLAHMPLPEVAKTYRMLKIPEIDYVELNPQGQQTLVFIHGLGSYLKFWRYQLDAFAQAGFHVLALDMLGYGKSDKPASFPYTMEAMADVVRELIQVKSQGKPVLLGHSMGGQIALSYAIRYPTEVAALVLASPAGFEKFSSKDRQWYHAVLRSSSIVAADEYSVWGSVRKANFSHWKDDFEWLIEERVRLADTPEFKSYAYANVKSIEGLADNNFVRENLGHVQTPTLIIYGGSDALIPNRFFSGGWTRAIMEYGHNQIQGSELVELAGCGHMIQMDCAVDFNNTVLKYFAAQPPDTSSSNALPRGDDDITGDDDGDEGVDVDENEPAIEPEVDDQETP